jgi:hypothetical protein
MRNASAFRKYPSNGFIRDGTGKVGTPAVEFRVRCIQPRKERLLAPRRAPSPLCALSSSIQARAPAEAVLTPPPILFDRALVFEAG